MITKDGNHCVGFIHFHFIFLQGGMALGKCGCIAHFGSGHFVNVAISGVVPAKQCGIYLGPDG
jgi:hypothetical protein